MGTRGESCSFPAQCSTGWWSAVPLGEITPKREEGQRDEFEMLFAERDPDDGDGEDDPVDEVGDGDFPTEEHQPEQVENCIHWAVGAGFEIDFFAEGSHGGDANFKSLYAKGDANDGQAQDGATQKIPDPSQKTTEDKPDEIAKKVHG